MINAKAKNVSIIEFSCIEEFDSWKRTNPYYIIYDIAINNSKIYVIYNVVN